MAAAPSRLRGTVIALTVSFILAFGVTLPFGAGAAPHAIAPTASHPLAVTLAAQNAAPAAPDAAQQTDTADTETPPAQDGAAGDETAADETVGGGAEPADDEAGSDETAEGEDEDGSATDYGRFQSIMSLVEAGGPIIVILAVLSFISLAIILAKLVQFAVLRVNKRSFIKPTVDLVCAGKLQEAIDSVAATPGVVARVMEAALKGKTLGPAAEDIAREEVTRVAQAKLDGLESGLTFLRLIATISPLLGLLGTVLGMIEAFQQLQSAGDRVDPAILSGGIWEALLTTAAGLSVAIPAAAFYTALQRTVDVTAQAMEDAATQCFTAPLYTAGPTPAPAVAETSTAA
ncbi:MAG: MotA/TolQ/ExbB proton channel family protein [Alphaproteobacteria bacterium]